MSSRYHPWITPWGHENKGDDSTRKAWHSQFKFPTQTGKVKILYLRGQKKSQMPVGLPGRGELGKRMSKPCIYWPIKANNLLYIQLPLSPQSVFQELATSLIIGKRFLKRSVSPFKFHVPKSQVVFYGCLTINYIWMTWSCSYMEVKRHVALE